MEPYPMSFKKLKLNRPNKLPANVAFVGSDAVTMLRGTFGDFTEDHEGFVWVSTNDSNSIKAISEIKLFKRES